MLGPPDIFFGRDAIRILIRSPRRYHQLRATCPDHRRWSSLPLLSLLSVIIASILLVSSPAFCSESLFLPFLPSANVSPPPHSPCDLIRAAFTPDSRSWLAATVCVTQLHSLLPPKRNVRWTHCHRFPDEGKPRRSASRIPPKITM